MPNAIAFLALASFPLVVMALFGRLPVDRALIWSVLIGYLFLPEPPAVFDLPAAPPLTKHNVPALMAFLITLYRRDLTGGLLPHSMVGKALVLAFVFSPALTVLTNGEPVFWGQIGLPGLGIKDIIALCVQQFLLILPFLMARQFLASGGSQRELLKALMIAGLVYSLFMLVEIRLSPQLNLWIYGYYQHFFGQSIRFGGYRPVVFLYHGLWVAFFTFMAVTAAWGLWRLSPGKHGAKLLIAALYLTGVLVLAKSLGALIFVVVAVPVVVLLPVRWQVRVAIVIGLIAFGYPLLKGAGLIPEQALLAKAAAIDPDRAASLRFRFMNENTLLDRAYLKPFFGWGSWGRNHILDPISGFIVTVTDGRWIITIGVYGWLGFVAEFGLILLPLVLIAREVRLAPETAPEAAKGEASIARGAATWSQGGGKGSRHDAPDGSDPPDQDPSDPPNAPKAEAVSPLVGPLAILLSLNLADMIPNATLTPLTWLLCGALLGYAEHLRSLRLAQPDHRADTASPSSWSTSF